MDLIIDGGTVVTMAAKELFERAQLSSRTAASWMLARAPNLSGSILATKRLTQKHACMLTQFLLREKLLWKNRKVTTVDVDMIMRMTEKTREKLLAKLQAER